MQHLVTFRLSRECRDIAVNPAKILYVNHYETGASALHFGKGLLRPRPGRSGRGHP